jgi:hypothetical protein
MAIVALHKVADDWYAELDTAMNDSVTSVVLANSGATGSPSVPFYLDIDGEQMRCSAIATDTPSAGKDTLTVSRGENGTSAASHSAAATVAQNVYGKNFTELQDQINAISVLLTTQLANAEGVITSDLDTLPELKVTAQGTPDMTVNIAVGPCVVSGQITRLATATDTAAMTAPTGDPRIDVVQINQSGTVSVVTGVENASPSAPAVDSNNIKLAEIYHRVGETVIKDTDDASNGYITDSRTFP